MTWLVQVICSDEDCAAVEEREVTRLEALDLEACLCGCTWQVLRVYEVTAVVARPVAGAAPALAA